MMTSRRAYRLVIPILVAAIAATFALLPQTPASAASASKSCVASGTNVYTCAFTIVPGVATSGSWLVQMVAPLPGSFVGTPSVSASTGCTAAVSGGGTLISTPMGVSDYDVAVSSCGAGASVTVIETIAVTSSGVICQRVWVHTASPFAQACASVTYTAPSTGVGASPKVCTASSTPNVYDCTFTVSLTAPAAAGDRWPVAMTGPGALGSAPTVASFSGCGVAPVVTQTGMLVNNTTVATYEATVGAGGCSPGAVVLFNERITVTGDGQICQTVWVNPMIPGVTGCAQVTLAKALTPPAGGGGKAGKGSFAAPPNFGGGAAALAIFEGGSVGQLEAAVGASGGSGVWVQDTSGAFRLLIANGPTFLRDAFASMFPEGFPGVVSVTVTRAG